MKREKAIKILLSILSILCIGHGKRVARNYNHENAENDVTEDKGNNIDAGIEKYQMMGSYESIEIPNGSDQRDEESKLYRLKVQEQSDEDKDCWLDLGIKRLYHVMDKLDGDPRERDLLRLDMDTVSRGRAVRSIHFSTAREPKCMDRAARPRDTVVSLNVYIRCYADGAILEDQGRAQRALHNVGGDPRLIPAGLNLGGYCMMRMDDSILFFHRMKLRNNTRFRINYLHNDLMNMLLTARLSLNDLHLFGEYERAMTPHDPSYLMYKPTYGQIEVLLKDAEYKMEGRYRLLKDRLFIELVVSEITVKDVVLKCPSCENKNIRDKLSVNKRKAQVDEFLHRLKLDLDRWLKDYFNDYLALFELASISSRSNFLNYDKKKALVLNDFVDRSLDLFKYKLRKMKAVALKVPDFTLHTSTGTVINLRRGVVRGLDSMHRRSVATGKKDAKVRYVDAIIGFSKIKLEYKYETQLMRDVPPLHGFFILSADELTAQMALALVEDPQAFDLTIEFSQQVKPESLTVEGSINRRIANFKHLLENHIISIMSNTLIHHIRMLSYLSKCGTNNAPLPGFVDSGEIFSEEDFPTTQRLTRKPTTSHNTPKKNLTFPPQNGGNNSGEDGNDGGNDGNDNDSGKNDNKDKDRGKGYAVNRIESAELVLPSINGEPEKTMHLNYNETFLLDEVEPKTRYETDKGNMYNAKDSKENDNSKNNNYSDKNYNKNSNDHDENGKNKYGDGNNKGTGYGVHRIESAELVLPSIECEPEETMHLNYTEAFLLDEAEPKTRYETDKGKMYNAEDGNEDDNNKNNNDGNKNSNYHDEIDKNKYGGNNKETGYSVHRIESAELVLPPIDGNPGKTMNLKYKQTFSLD